jgi:Cu2+-exporting ATPase
MSEPATVCFHCHEPLGNSRQVAVLGARQEPVCCSGCKAVAELINGAGLADFYDYRTAAARSPAKVSSSAAWSSYTDPAVAARCVQTTAQGHSVLLAIENLSCAACGWLIEQMLLRLPGVIEVSVNAATARACVEWRGEVTLLAEILASIERLGMQALPLSETAVNVLRQQEWRSALKRLAVATAGMMQVMMFAIGVYAAHLEREQFDPTLLQYFRLLSLLITTPVLFYAGAPFLLNAWQSLRVRSIGMDVPVSLALVLAYTASTWHTLQGDLAKEVYFDSVCMFIFFLTLGRCVQMAIRHRTGSVSEALAQQLPGVAHVLRDGITHDVSPDVLAPADVVLVKSGELLPADGLLLDAEAEVDESLLSGESLPVRKVRGERLAAGTLNVAQPLKLEVRASGRTTLLAGMVALLERAQARKPGFLKTADLAAARFLIVVLICAVATCVVWLSIDPRLAFAVTLAVLVAACPCAFAIAAPSALAAASAALARQGVLVTDPDALEALARVDTIVFDKTGTLTRGRIALGQCVTRGALPEEECLQLAAALESISEHPLARAFEPFKDQHVVADSFRVTGRGIEGRVADRDYRIGTRSFVAELRGDTSEASEPSGSGIWVFLGDATGELAAIELQDSLRRDAVSALVELRELGIEPQLASGDRVATVAEVASLCRIEHFAARQTPAQKLELVAALQAGGKRVAVVGDGVNDAPVLGVANVAVAMGGGTALAQASAGIVLVSEQLSALPKAIRTARRMLHISRQNLGWAAIYNVSALSLAAAGLVPPWLAALGMAASSVAVMANAMRLLPPRRRPAPRASVRATATPHRWQEARP